MKTNPGDGPLDQTEEPMKIDFSKGRSHIAGFAGALVELAKNGVGLDVVDSDLRLVKETVAGHMDLKKTLADPALPVEQKQAVVSDLFSGKVSDVTFGFLQLLTGMGQMQFAPDIADEFTERLEAAENKVVAEVTTAIPMDVDFVGYMARKLSEMAGREVAVRPKVDPDLIGGVVVRIGGKLLDGSIRSRLDQLHAKMLLDMRGK